MKLTLLIEQDNICYIDEKETKAAVLEFEETETNIYVNSIKVDEILRGKGIAGQLMEEIMKVSKEKNKKISPICSYAKKWLEQNG